MKIRFFTLTMAVLLAMPTCYAVSIPKKSIYDSRIKHTAYNEEDVYQLDAVVGIVTHIILEEDEKYVAHAFGDSNAWYFTYEGNHIFIKPKEEDGDTNLVLVTDRRSYNFKLRYHPSEVQKDAKGRLIAQDMTFQLAFTYPDTALKIRKTQDEKQKIESGLGLTSADYNCNYTMRGSQDIAPINAWDDNVFTYFKFPGNRDLPAIYMVNPDGSETLVNQTIKGNGHNIVVLQKVAKEWVFRLSDSVLGVYNENYDSIGIENTSGTVSPVVTRVVKENS